MENTNNLFQSSNISPSSTYNSASASASMSNSSDGGFFDGLKNINATTWILIILILAFFGFNIFIYLAKGTQTIADIFRPITEKLFGTTVSVTGQAIDVSAEGAKAVVSETASAIESGLTAIQDITPNKATSSVKGQPIDQQKIDTAQQNTLDKALKNGETSNNYNYEAHEASSSVNSSGKAGWCYVGDDRGFRSCAQVGVNDTCMSGDIFPSQEICMNPNMRA
jgi:hypothetical protein